MRKGGRGALSHVLTTLQSSGLISVRLRWAMLVLAGIEVPRSACIYERCYFYGDVSIGPEAFVNIGCVFDGSGGITIEREVHLAHDVRLLTSTHRFGPASRRGGQVETAPVTIRAGCWLGASVTVLPGVTIAEGCVIGAGAVVTRSTEANGLYLGVPARLVRRLEHDETWPRRVAALPPERAAS